MKLATFAARVAGAHEAGKVVLLRTVPRKRVEKEEAEAEAGSEHAEGTELGEIAHSMLNFAGRLCGEAGTISACGCISRERERRRAERTLENVVETFSTHIETRVAHASVEEFLRWNTSNYDIAFIGASTDRSAASRFLSAPTFERVRDVECDLAIVDTS